MQRLGDRPTLSPIGGSDTPIIRIVAVVAALIALAVLKPWGGASPETAGRGPDTAGPNTGSPSGSVAERTVEPTPRPTANPDEIFCFGDGWRLVTLQTYGDRRGGTWVVVEPASATGPDDPGIPVTRLVEGHVSGLGFCDNAATEATGPAQIVNMWRLGAGADGFAVRWLGAPRPYRGQLSEGIPAAILYDPPDDLGVLVSGPAGAGSVATPSAGAAVSPGPTTASDGGWPPGRYVFLVDSGGTPSWFGLDLVWPPPNAPAGQSSPAPGSAAPTPPRRPSPSAARASGSAHPAPSAP